MLTTTHSPLADRMVDCRPGLLRLLAAWQPQQTMQAGKWDNRCSWNNKKGGFDNRHDWDNWNKK